jgi:hypothetical protein
VVQEATVTLSHLIGTPQYMAPELFTEGTVSRASDVYALGITAFQLLTGRVPFTASNPFQLMQQHASAPVPALGEGGHGALPPALQAVIERALAKDYKQRFATAGALARAFAAALAPPGESPQERRLAEWYTEALAASQRGEWARTVALLDEVVAARPGYREAEAQRAEARRQLRLAEHYTAGRRAAKAGDWAQAVTLLATLADEASGYRDATVLLAEARRLGAARLDDRAREQARAGDRAGAADTLAQLRPLAPDHPDPEGLAARTRADQAVPEAREHRAALSGAAPDPPRAGGQPAPQRPPAGGNLVVGYLRWVWRGAGRKYRRVVVGTTIVLLVLLLIGVRAVLAATDNGEGIGGGIGALQPVHLLLLLLIVAIFVVVSRRRRR